MAEIIQSDGTWTFDGELLRIVPGSDKSVSLLRRELGELAVPLHALAGVAFEPGRKTGRLRLRLRHGADPLTQVVGSQLDDDSDPYQLTVQNDRFGVAEYLVDAVRQALTLDQVPADPCEAYLLPGPRVPLTASAGDGVAGFDGEHVRLEWNWKTPEAKSAAGTRLIPVGEITAVEWQPSVSWENGYLRLTVRGAETKAPPKHDPNSVELWGFRKDPLMALVAAAVQARLPHPSAGPAGAGRPALPAAEEPAAAAAPAAGGSAADHDALLRRLRELGELRRDGVLTEEEFAAAKRAVLRQL